MIGEIRQIVAEVNGGKHGSSRYSAHFACEVSQKCGGKHGSSHRSGVSAATMREVGAAAA